MFISSFYASNLKPNALLGERLIARLLQKRVNRISLKREVLCQKPMKK
jgi:hypothetical protein